MATKTTITTITGDYGSKDLINANFVALADAIDLLVSRDGESPNTMLANLDMNSHKLINVTDPTNNQDAATKIYVDDRIATGAASAAAAAASAAAALASETAASGYATDADTARGLAVVAQGLAETAQTAAEAAQTAAELALDSFDDRYLGAKASDPTLDNDGDPLLTGALYFNTALNQMKVYSGATWSIVPQIVGIVSNADATAITIDSNENVGVGTATPYFRLCVADSAGGSTRIQVTNTEGEGSGDGLHIVQAGVNSSISNKENGYLSLETNDLERMRIDSAGNVGIGTTSPGTKLQINEDSTSGGVGGLVIKSADSNESLLSVGVSTSLGRAFIASLSNGAGTAQPLDFITGTSSTNVRMRIDSAGNVGIGATAPNYRVHLHENSSGSNYLQFTNTTTGSTNADGFIIGADGSEHVRLHNYYNSDMIFATNAAERMRITSAGEFLVGKTSSVLTTVGHTLFPSGIAYHTTSGQPGLYINRLASDGDLAVFYQASVNEGSISVSGTTVSYNGAHLSRWSQLPEGVVPFEIPRGTVMSLVDEMCVWEGEDNEQLTRSIPSTTPGDTNIAGVFQNYDDSDEGDDFYIAQTGDFVIRVKGNVPLGAFLESAGDGTARPQADQTHVLRSTIARATKGVVQASDEETLLPCLLMAC